MNEEILKGYLACAMFAETTDDEQIDDVSDAFKDRAVLDVNTFVASIDPKDLEQALSEQDASQIGHDFWLTRQGHGAGFWDGDYSEELGKRLTAKAKAMGEIYHYCNDENLLCLD